MLQDGADAGFSDVARAVISISNLLDHRSCINRISTFLVDEHTEAFGFSLIHWHA